ncbi:MAG TPA: transglutaminase family protein [Candidatus Acidoferrales bacterium]|nr:transglutaminase family protein [Candidatus Acidoferrales bacterium]
MMDDSPAQYVVSQRFSYVYPGPIHNLRHRLLVSPLDRDAGQRRLQRRLHISPDVSAVDGTDAFGNDVVYFDAQRIEGRLEIEAESMVERRPGFEFRRVDPRWLIDPLFRSQTPLTRADAAMRCAALKLKRESANDAELVASINSFVFERMEYRKEVTSVATTAAQAFRLRAGVCQDYAHVVIALARACGLAARYVSGHLLGEGGTHAWIEIILPSEDGGAVAWPFDPTHNRHESLDYIAVAIGRDYRDVAPTSGTFDAPYNGVLTCAKVVRRLPAA